MAVRQPTVDRSSRRAWLVAASLLVLFVAALFLRAYWNLDAATQDGQFVLSAGSDPYYHKRAIDHIQDNGYQTLIQDPMLNYPYGSINPNPPLYQWSVALAGHFLAPFFSATETMSSEQVSTWYAFLWSPAIYGALTLFPIYFIGAALFSRRAGLVAALFWTVSTSSIDTTGLGSADHDAAIVFFSSLAFLFYIKAIEQFRGDGNWVQRWNDGSAIGAGLSRFGRDRRLGLMYSLLAGVATASVALTWKGFPYLIGIFFAYAGIQMVLDHWRNRDSTGVFVGTLLTMLVGTLLAVPYYNAAGVENFLRPVWFLIAGFAVAGLVLVPTRDLPTILVMPAALLVAILGALVAFFVAPDIANSLLYATVYFKQTALYETIAEAHPADFSTLVFSIGPVPYFLALFGFVVLLFSLKKYPGRAGLFAVVWAAIAIYMATSAVRFVFNALPILVVLAGFGLAWVLDWLQFGAIRKSLAANQGNFWQGLRKGTRATHVVAVVLLALLLVVPNTILAADAAMPPQKEAALAGDGDGFVAGFVEKRLGTYGQGFIPDYWQDGLVWLDQHDANTTDISERPGFLAWWDYGHWAIYVGRHPAVADNFQNGYEFAARFLLAESEEEAVQLLAARLIGLPELQNGRAEAILAENGVADPAAAAASLTRHEAVDSITLEQANAILAAFEQETGKSIRYFTTDIRMLPYDNPQTTSYIEQPSIFYAPVRLAGENPDDYVTHQIAVGNSYVTQDEYRELARDPIRPVAPVGERYAYQEKFFNTMYWRGYVGSPVQAQTFPVTGEQVANALPVPGYGLQNFRLVYQNDGLKTLEYFPGAIVTGTVTEDGQPLSGVTLTAYDDAGEIIVSSFGDQGQFTADQFNVPHGEAETDASGQFRLVAPFAMPGGVVTVVATTADGTEVGRAELPISREDAQTGREFNVDLVVQLGNVEGVAFEDVDGDGAFTEGNDTLVPDVNVTIAGKTATTGADGRYRIDGISAGQQPVTVDSERYNVTAASASVRVQPNQTATHNLTLETRPASVSGIAWVDANSDGVRGEDEGLDFATLSFAPAEGVEGNGATAEDTLTASNGAYNVALRAGSYTVTAQHGETTYTFDQPVTVAVGEQLELDLQFAAPAAE